MDGALLRVGRESRRPRRAEQGLGLPTQLRTDVSDRQSQRVRILAVVLGCHQRRVACTAGRKEIKGDGKAPTRGIGRRDDSTHSIASKSARVVGVSCLGFSHNAFAQNSGAKAEYKVRGIVSSADSNTSKSDGNV